jgi:thiosulfate/3-mercaptopyruvate sulfurtransferase
MPEPVLPLLIEPETLATALKQPDHQLLLVDVCSAEAYAEAHVPGALHVSPAELQAGNKPAVGKLPSNEALQAIFSRLGLSDQHHVVAMDREGGGWAGRLLWTLDVLGHEAYSYLNGGVHAWNAEGLELSSDVPRVSPVQFEVSINKAPIASAEHIVSRLGDQDFAIWDARSAEEHRGEKVLSQRGGHIPGAVNIDWLELIDRDNNYRLIDLDALQTRLDALGLGAESEIVTHCQSHHRSSLTYLVMKILGYPRVRGYDGSWSEWGNLADTPINDPGSF